MGIIKFTTLRINSKAMLVKRLYLLIILFKIACLGYAQTLHVDGSTSSENQNGTADHPFSTIQQAVDNAQQGDVILIHSGIYREEVEIPVDSITIKSTPGAKVTVSGAEPVLNWIPMGDEVYKAAVPWDVKEGNQSNQVFVDGEMMHLARWPKQTHPDFVTHPVFAVMDEVKDAGTSSFLLTENEFDQPKQRWLNAKAWVNFSHNNHDGQGWSGTVSFVSTITNSIKITDEGGQTTINIGNGNFNIGPGSEFYLFGPDSAGVYGSGGPTELLARGEWWKNSDTLYVRLPNGGVPASHIDSTNLVEAKKRIWAFKPAGSNKSGLVISDMDIFAASILTDLDYDSRESATYPLDAEKNTFKNLNFKYITHFIDNNANMSGHLWFQRSGLILGGSNSAVINCTFSYSAGSAISAFGKGHRIMGNKIYDVNYHVLESGAINGGSWLADPQIGHNLIYNSPLVGIVLNQVHSSDTSVVGNSRIHHNLINRFMLHGHDGGAINASAGRDWENIRVDHNLIMNAPNFLSVGIYFDFGGNTLIDHNVVYNSWSAMSLNRWADPLGIHRTYNNTLINSSITSAGYGSSFRDGDGELMIAKNNLASGTWFSGSFDKGIAENNVFVNSASTLNGLVENYTMNNFIPMASASSLIDKGSDVAPYNDTVVGNAPDIGAYEYGVEPWLAGPEGVISDIELTHGPTNLKIGDTLHIQARVFANGFVPVDTANVLTWHVPEGGKFIEDGVFIAESETSQSYIRVSDSNNLLKKYIAFRVEKNSTRTQSKLFNDEMNVSLFPNPTSQFIHLESNQYFDDIEITDLNGRSLYHFEKKSINEKSFTIDVSLYPSGVYFIIMSSKSEIKTLKFLKY